MLDPDVVLRADRAAERMGASAEVRGANAGGQPRVVFEFTIAGGKVVAIALVADPERLRQLDLAVLDD